MQLLCRVLKCNQFMSWAKLPGRNCIGFLQVPAEKSDLLEAVKAHRGKSEPLFLLYRVRRLSPWYFCSTHSSCTSPYCLPALQNGILKQKIEGANTPALSQYIVQFTPVSADTDDLAVSLRATYQLEKLCASSSPVPSH